MGEKIIIYLNKFFKKREHPFNMKDNQKLNYADFEYKSSKKVFADFEKSFSSNIKDIVTNKDILDLGCGAGGKSLFLYEKEAKTVTGIDLSEILISQGNKFIEQKGYKNNIKLHLGNVCDIKYPDNSFDILVANDLMEHVDRPELMLEEAYRVLRPDGQLLINFEPYYHFLGHHMWDTINIPWAHVFFSEKNRINAYKKLVSGLPDGDERINFRVDKKENGEEYIGYLNLMTLHRFQKILKKSKFTIKNEKLIPIDKFPFNLLYKIPLVREFCLLRVIYILKK